jgi:hypothetical protein
MAAQIATVGYRQSQIRDVSTMIIVEHAGLKIF